MGQMQMTEQQAQAVGALFDLPDEKRKGRSGEDHDERKIPALQILLKTGSDTV